MALISPSENKYRAEAALATSPLMKFANILPSSEVLNLSSLPDTASSALRPGANQAPGPVPTSRFLTASPAYSSNPTAGLLRPAPEHGVHLVFRVPFPSCAEARNGNEVTVLKMRGFTPFYEFPDTAAFRVSTAFSFLTFALEQQPTSLSTTGRNLPPIIPSTASKPTPSTSCADSYSRPRAAVRLSEVVPPGRNRPNHCAP